VILGNGSNLLAPDEGYRGVVIRTAALADVGVAAHTLTASCGTPLQAVVRQANSHGLCGFSRMAGIPATLGGALYMNAGAFGECIGDTVISVRAIPATGGVPLTLSRAECDFSYRKSVFQRRGLVILSARLSGGWAPRIELLK
jgi:UDP-N-acetylmuramate dehydrogenase